MRKDRGGRDGSDHCLPTETLLGGRIWSWKQNWTEEFAGQNRGIHGVGDEQRQRELTMDVFGDANACVTSAADTQASSRF